MGSLGQRSGGGGRSSGTASSGVNTPGGGTTQGGGSSSSGRLEYADDGARSMPSYNARAIADAIKRATAGIVGRSGRASTNLTGAGTRSYVGSLLGNVM